MEREREDTSSSSSGINPWALLVLISIFILLFVPSFLSAPFRVFRPTVVKRGWDTLNFVLVLFAILCGVLGRWNAGDDVDKSPSALSSSSSSSNHWYNNYSDSTATGMRRMRSSSSYPDLRQEAVLGGASVSEGWRFYDDIELYRRRPESRSWERQSFGDSAAKTIPVDTFVLRRSPSPRPREPLPTVTQRLPRRRSMERLRDNVLDKDEILEPGTRQPPSPPAEAQPRQRLRRGRSLEKLPEREVERDGNRGTRHRRRRSLEDISNWEMEQDWISGLQKPHRRSAAPPPPPPPPPPPLNNSKEKRSHKKRSGGGAKDIAAAIALFYQKKKKGSKIKRTNSDVGQQFVEAAASTQSPPPPPPPPPPSSVFQSLFSIKKTKSRRIHSLSVAPPPPPPPPPSSLFSAQRRSKKQVYPPPTLYRSRKESPLPPPPPPTIHRSRKESPLPPPPAPRQSNLHKNKKSSNLSNYPLPPLSPLLPPPPPPVTESDPKTQFSGNEEVESHSGERVTEEGMPAYCPSPDVNNKADLFIARFRAGLKLEKLNSVREKQGQLQKEEAEEEFMVIGSLFDDDLTSC
ncbi:formin-like protein 20 [Canna indica]|uniref:Formin-like protein 20 n=1 Tax=Canna indica TaxID=4628 RepID=A0AAQ3QT20_9LILI|nr:formin-like protein 20 [Canna indica]